MHNEMDDRLDSGITQGLDTNDLWQDDDESKVVAHIYNGKPNARILKAHSHSHSVSGGSI